MNHKKETELSPWLKSDNDWFSANQSRSYRIRRAIHGEPMLAKYSGIPPANYWVIVRKVTYQAYIGIGLVLDCPLPDDESVLCAFYENKKNLKNINILCGRVFLTVEE